MAEGGEKFRHPERVIFCVDHLGDPGGISTVVNTLAGSLRSLGIDIAYVSLWEPVSSVRVPGPVFSCNLGSSFTTDHPLAARYPGRFGLKLTVKRLLTRPWRLWRKLRIRTFLRGLSERDALIMFLPPVATTLLGEMAKCRQKKVTSIFQGHTSFDGFRAMGMMDELKGLAGQVDLFLMLTRRDAELTASEIGREVSWMKNPSDARYVELKREKKVVFVGRLASEKRVELAIQSFELAADVVDGWILEIYGEGESRGMLEQIIHDSRHAKRISLMGHSDRIDEVLSGSSLAILTSVFEGQPMAMIEAARCGVPTVAVGCVPEVERIAVRCGYLARGDSPEEIADALVGAMVSPESLERRSRDAFEYGDKHEARQVAQNWLGLLSAEHADM